MTDPISDMLTRIRNACLARKAEVRIPYSKIKESIVQILKDNGYVVSYSVEGEIPQKQLVVALNEDGRDANISELVRVSKPGRRIYSSSREIPRVLNGRGIVILSTSSGLMTGREAKQRGLGGEVICKVW